MSAASGGLVRRKPHHGSTSSYVPNDRRTEDPRPVQSVSDDGAAVTALVQSRLGEAGGDVLAALGLAVAS